MKLRGRGNAKGFAGPHRVSQTERLAFDMAMTQRDKLSAWNYTVSGWFLLDVMEENEML
jgi:hypothetical protein